ncbi:MAG: acyltransferase [Verrucomicrobia bacterium]|nr:acyltransferase [Verrucomicrobiota bacterium]
MRQIVPPPPDARSEFLQQIRGLCIVAVVLIHTVGMPINDETSYLLVLMRGFINFPVAVFFFLAGFFNKSAGSYAGTERKKLFSRIIRLLVPYIFWTAFYLCAYYSLSVVAGKPFDLLRVPKAFLFGSATAPLYFLHVLLQLTLITPILVAIIRGESLFSKVLKWGLFGTTPLYILVRYGYDFCAGTDLPHYELPCFAWFTYYYLGLFCAQNRGLKTKTLGLFPSVLIAFLALFIAIWEGFAIYNQAGSEMFSLAASQTRLGSMLFSLAIINLILRIKDTNPKPNGVLSALGDYSFGIYSFHMFWMIPLAFVFSRMIFTPEILPILKVIQAFICLGATFFACKFTEKKIGSKTAKILGLK